MTKFEKELLDNFDNLYQKEINGFKWEDCCDYENDLPTWFYFVNNKYWIEGYYDMGIYRIYRNYKYNYCEQEPLKTFKTLKCAMNYGNRNM